MRINLRLLAAAATALLLTATTAVVAAGTGGGLVVVGPVGHVVEQRLQALQQRPGFGLRAADHLGQLALQLGVWANHPNTAGIKAYPNATRRLGKRVSTLGTTSSFNVTVPTSGAVGPLGSLQTSTTVGGHTWAIYRGSNGANQAGEFLLDRGNVGAEVGQHPSDPRPGVEGSTSSTCSVPTDASGWSPTAAEG